MRAIARDGVRYEISLRFFDWGGRRNKGFTLLKEGKPITAEQSSHTNFQTLAAQTAGETNEPRYDAARRWNAESSTGERLESLGREQVQDLISNKPIKEMTYEEKVAAIQLDTQLYLRRVLTVTRQGVTWTITEVESQRENPALAGKFLSSAFGAAAESQPPERR